MSNRSTVIALLAEVWRKQDIVRPEILEHQKNGTATTDKGRAAWAKWIALEDEAKRLQQQLDTRE